MNRLAACAVLALTVAACAPVTGDQAAEITKDADVTSYSADSVTVTSWFDEIGDGFGQSEDALPEATRACGLAGKRPELLGIHEAATPTPNVWSGLDYKYEFEFACV